MNQKVLDFLSSQRVCCLAIILPDGSAHAATMHYSHKNEPLKLFFSTEKTGKKCLGLLDGKVAKGSVVIGFSEEEWLTLQMDGEVKAILDPEELKSAKVIHYPKIPTAQEFECDPATIFLTFTPSWWRFTDFNVDPPVVLDSQQ